MSSEVPVRFEHPLRSVRSAGAPAAGHAAEETGSAEALQLAERRRRLEAAEQALARRDQELIRREADLAEQQRAVEARLGELAALIGGIQDKKAEMLEASEEEIVSLSLSITEKVLQHEVESGRYRIDEVVKAALRVVRDRGSLVVRVNPHDHELARAAVEKLERTYGTTRIATVPDESIPLASCCIETDSGKIFSEIPGRLERIKHSLLKKNGESDGV
jgi:flagellar biosynthesis/type III secretory pathway protein FliH